VKAEPVCAADVLGLRPVASAASTPNKYRFSMAFSFPVPAQNRWRFFGSSTALTSGHSTPTPNLGYRSDLHPSLYDWAPRPVNGYVPAVGDLNGLRRAGAGAADVFVGAVAADDLDLGMHFQPLAQGVSGALGQEVHRAVPFQVTQDRAIAVALAKGPVVNAEDADGWTLREWSPPDAA
jgi:hypothetical protein